MTDREEFEKWAKHHDVNTMRMTISNAYMSNGAYLAWASWQARGELDAVHIKELEGQLDESNKQYKERRNELVNKVAELTAKLDAAKDFFKTMENNTYSFVSVYQMLSKNALEELDK